MRCGFHVHSAKSGLLLILPEMLFVRTGTVDPKVAIGTPSPMRATGPPQDDTPSIPSVRPHPPTLKPTRPALFPATTLSPTPRRMLCCLPTRTRRGRVALGTARTRSGLPGSGRGCSWRGLGPLGLGGLFATSRALLATCQSWWRPTAGGASTSPRNSRCCSSRSARPGGTYCKVG